MTTKPEALKKGSRIALISPASRPESVQAVARAEAVVEKMGFKPVIAKHALTINGYLAGTDQERAQDIMDAFLDDSIAGIFCLEGGFGSIKTLAHLDFSRIKKHPKVFMGSHENTCLLTALQYQGGMVVFHGPNICSVDKVECISEIKQTLASTNILPSITPSLSTFPAGFHHTPFAGTAQGIVIGGNMNALASLMGTKYSAHFTNKIVFFCERSERNDIIERCFTNLHLAGYLKRIAGIAFGEFPDCGPKDSASMKSYQDILSERVIEHKVPTTFNMPIGDSSFSRVMPIGIKAKLDATNGKIEFAEPALV
ncbi:MAG: LD-carboxypeptidase [Cyanobacteria bacterium TGS_CYA1]|nr:LD-carboxypeptidase [Cyanobacteria bacterium TGS_CYA1]